jgi:CheY-like chemotaxis protein
MALLCMALHSLGVERVIDRWQSEIVRRNLLESRVPLNITRPFQLDPLDVAGPITVEAVKGGQVDVGMLLTSDPGIAVNGFVLLDLLKHDPDTRDIPVHVISGGDGADAAQGMGVLGVTSKPAAREELKQIFARIRRDAKGSKRARRARGAPHQAESEPRRIPELEGATVLIVDDDIRNIYSLTSVLESYGVEVLHAERGREGIGILERSNVDLALIDIMMPEMDGYETMQQIRARAALSDLPLVAVTAKAMKGDRQKCLEAGASDYIAKPVDLALLLALLRVWVGRSRERAGPPRAAGETLAAVN